jgi:transcriptional regulator with XRE-family HTH domain
MLLDEIAFIRENRSAMSKKSAKQISISKAIGAYVRQRREVLKCNQEDLARRAREYGLAWMQPTVASIEAGRRRLTVEEFILLREILDTVSHTDLLQEGYEIALTPTFTVRSGDLRAWLGGRQHPLERIPTANRLLLAKFQLEDAAAQDAERKAARKLHVEPLVIAKTAKALWGHSLTEERNNRLKKEAKGSTAPPEGQQVLGWITRGLVEELKTTLKPEKQQKVVRPARKLRPKVPDAKLNSDRPQATDRPARKFRLEEPDMKLDSDTPPATDRPARKFRIDE